MAGCMEGFKRANLALHGDLEGPMTKLKSGRLSVSIIDGQVVAWVVGAEDVILSKDNVKAVTLSQSGVSVVDLTSGGGKTNIVNVYTIEMTNGDMGILRLKVESATKVLMLLQ